MALRNLLGNAKEIVHDPGPKGDSGEGDAALIMIFLVICAALVILVYGESLQPSLDDVTLRHDFFNTEETLFVDASQSPTQAHSRTRARMCVSFMSS